MLKHQEKKLHLEGKGESWVGKSNELITLLTKDGEEREWALAAVNRNTTSSIIKMRLFKKPHFYFGLQL